MAKLEMGESGGFRGHEEISGLFSDIEERLRTELRIGLEIKWGARLIMEKETPLGIIREAVPKGKVKEYIYKGYNIVEQSDPVKLN